MFSMICRCLQRCGANGVACRACQRLQHTFLLVRVNINKFCWHKMPFGIFFAALSNGIIKTTKKSLQQKIPTPNIFFKNPNPNFQNLHKILYSTSQTPTSLPSFLQKIQLILYPPRASWRALYFHSSLSPDRSWARHARTGSASRKRPDLLSTDWAGGRERANSPSPLAEQTTNDQSQTPGQGQGQDQDQSQQAMVNNKPRYVAK